MVKTDKIKKFFKKPCSKGIVLVVSCAVIILFTLVFSIVTLAMRHGKVKVGVYVAPRDAELYLNDVKIKNHKNIYLEPGEYHLSAKREHFEDLESDFLVSKDLKYIATTMIASDSEGEEYINNHAAEYRKVEGYVGYIANKAGEIEREKYPIIKYLPINNKFYSISYSYPDYKGPTQDNGAPVITIKTDSSYLDVAVAKLKTFEGVSLIDYEIDFNIEERFNNPAKSNSGDAEKFLKESYKNSGFTLSSVEYLADNYAVGIFTIKDKYSLMPTAKHLALIQKEGEYWKIISTPKPLLTKFNTPDTSEDILNAANTFAGQ